MIFMKFIFLQYCNNCLFYHRTVCESYDITRKVWKVYITSPLLGRMIKPVIIGDVKITYKRTLNVSSLWSLTRHCL